MFADWDDDAFARYLAHYTGLPLSEVRPAPTEVKAWLAAHPRVHFHFTPTGASWLNLIEVWLSILTRKPIRRGSFDNVRALIQHIAAYLQRWNEHPVPFVWTKSADEIIQKALRH